MALRYGLVCSLYHGASSIGCVDFVVSSVVKSMLKLSFYRIRHIFNWQKVSVDFAILPSIPFIFFSFSTFKKKKIT